jgi:hypothetical protein
MPKDIEAILKEQREEYQRHLDVVVEGFVSQVKLIAESISGIQEQLIALREMVAKNTEDIEKIKMEMMVMKSDIQIIKQNLKLKVDVDDFTALEKRVALLEAKMSKR